MWINSLIGIRHGSGDDLKFSDLWKFFLAYSDRLDDLVL